MTVKQYFVICTCVFDVSTTFGFAIKPEAKRQFLSSYHIIILHFTKNGVMKRYSPSGRRNHGRPLKRLLDMWDRIGQQVAQLHDRYMMMMMTKNDFNCICVFFKDLPHISSGLLTLLWPAGHLCPTGHERVNWSVTCVILSHKFINSAWCNRFYWHMHNITYTTNTWI